VKEAEWQLYFFCLNILFEVLPIELTLTLVKAQYIEKLIKLDTVDSTSCDYLGTKININRIKYLPN
jgi:hypothetical protein